MMEMAKVKSGYQELKTENRVSFITFDRLA